MASRNVDDLEEKVSRIKVTVTSSGAIPPTPDKPFGSTPNWAA